MNIKIRLLILSVFILIIITVLISYNMFTDSSDNILSDESVTDITAGNNGMWSYLQWQESFPEQKKLIESFNELVHEDGKFRDFSITDPVRIAVVYPAIQASDYWIRNVRAFEIRLSEIGIPFKIEKYYSKPGETKLQHTQIKNVIDSDFDYLITTLDESADVTIIERILTEGRIKVILQNITTPLSRFGSSQPLLYTGFDHETGSIELARYYLEKFPEGGNWILLLFTDGIVSRERSEAFQRELSRNKNMKLLSIYMTEGDREKSRRAVLDAFSSFDKIDFIYSCATDTTVGALKALQELNIKKNIFLNGWGGGDLELQLINNNQLDITVMRMNDDAAAAMAEAISLDLQGAASRIPLVYSGAFEIVYPSMSARIDTLRGKAFRYSSGGR